MNNEYDFVGKMQKLDKETRKVIVGGRFYKAVEKCGDIGLLKQKRDAFKRRIAEIKDEANVFAMQDDLQSHKYDDLENSSKYSNLQDKLGGYEYYEDIKRKIPQLRAKRGLLNSKVRYLQDHGL